MTDTVWNKIGTVTATGGSSEFIAQLTAQNGFFKVSLLGIAYDQTKFITELANSYSLYTAIAASPSYQASIAVISGVTIANQNPATNSNYHYFLSGIVNAPGYNQVSYLSGLNTISTKMTALDIALTGHENEFATMYGITVAKQVMTDNDYLSVLGGIVQFVTPSGVSYDQAKFITELANSYSLYTAIAASDSYKASIAIISGVAVANQNPATNSSYHYFLSGVVNAPGYNQASYLAGLGSIATKMTEIDAAIGTNSLRDEFVTVYGIAIADQIFSSSNPSLSNKQYRDFLAGMASYMINNPSYTIATFTDVLSHQPAKMTNINNAIDTTALRNNFATVYGIAATDQLFNASNPALTNAAYRDLLAGLSSYMIQNPSELSPAKFAGTLPIMVSLDSSLATKNLRSNFATIYGIATNQQVFSNTAYRNIISGTASYMYSNSGYTIAKFENEIQKLPILDAALSSYNLRSVYAAYTGVYSRNQVFSNSEYKGWLSGMAGYMMDNPYYSVYNWIAEIQGIAPDANEYVSSVNTEVAAHNIRDAFASYYGISEPNQIMTNVDYVECLMRISLYINSTSGYSVDKFIQNLEAYKAAQLKTQQASEMVEAPTASPTVSTSNTGSEDAVELIALRSKLTGYSSGSTPQMVTSSQTLQQQQ